MGINKNYQKSISFIAKYSFASFQPELNLIKQGRRQCAMRNEIQQGVLKNEWCYQCYYKWCVI